MLELTDYIITEKIYAGLKTIVYRGYRARDRLPVVIKTLQSQYPDPKKVSQFYREFEMTKDLDLKGIIKHYELKKYKNSCFLIIEDIQGISLKEVIAAQSIDINTFLWLALQLTQALEALHTHNIIHKDVKPSNIIINLNTQQVRIIDFSISSRPGLNHCEDNGAILEGSLGYLSPEQTKRLDCTLDHRSDLYSLGIVFYEILLGYPPFQSMDAMELIHCHLAKQPTPPHQLNPVIPEVLSHIIMKLLAKIAEARYQSAYGLKKDLQICWEQWQTTQGIQTFSLGCQDTSGELHISQTLYGRETQIAILLDMLSRVSQGSKEVLLIKGYSGVGKSSLIKKMHKPVVQQGGYFITGKFDQFQGHIPYSALIQAFQGLMSQLLTETEAQINRWKALLLEALGGNAQIIIDVLPTLETIIGQQPAVPALAPTEAQNRFHLTFQRFVRVFAQATHPLIIFLDDLQWSDTATLQLLQTLIIDAQVQALLFAGAHRDNDTEVMQPTLVHMIEQLQESDIAIEQITLAPLKLTQIIQLLAESLQHPSEHLQPLAELILDKTGGNPFFINEFLKMLYHEQLLRFDKQWLWDLTQIQRCAITDNVVELMVKRIQTLPEATQTLLKLAACIGSHFDSSILSIIYEQPITQVMAVLQPALTIGLCLPVTEETYRFSHDRIQQAAYSLIEKNTITAMHHHIGQLLYTHTQAENLEEHVFDITNHLNQGTSEINTSQALLQLADLNLKAGGKAKAAIAYSAATKYFAMGLSLLPSDSWQQHYALTLALHVEAIETDYLNRHFTEAEQLTEIVLKQADTILDTVTVYETRILFYTSRNQCLRAIEVALEILSKLKITLCDKPTALTVSQLQQLPTTTDAITLAALRILMTMTPAVFIANSAFIPKIAFTMVDLCAKQGNTAYAAYGYALYGLTLCNTGQIEQGYQMSQLALDVLEKFQAHILKPKIYEIINVDIRPWREHLKTTLEPLQTTIQMEIENGYFEYACYSAIFYCDHLFFTGESLDKVAQEQVHYLEMIKRFKQSFHTSYLQIWQQSVFNLLGQTTDPCRLIGESFDERSALRPLIEAHNHISLFAFHLNKCLLNYLFGNHSQAINHARLAAREESRGGVCLSHRAELNFYYSLALLAQTAHVDPLEQAGYLDQLHHNQTQLHQWASHAPQNYQHKYHLIAAEQAALAGEVKQAMKLYDQAIEAARSQGYIQEAAIANELATQFYLTLGHEKIAKLYLEEAYQAYLSWGAQAKIKSLQKHYGALLASYTQASNLVACDMTPTATTSLGGELDLSTVIKASQTISSEIVFDQLLKKLMHIVLENSGAEQGWLILRKQDQFFVEAQGSVEEIHLLNAAPLESFDSHLFYPQLSKTIILYVARTQRPLVLHDASHHHLFANDPYILQRQPKSILTIPIIYKNKLIGVIYLENNLIVGAFTPERFTVLNLLSTQIAISLENALFYAQLEQAQHNSEQARYEAEVANRSKSTFLANMSHELRTPLNAIIGYSDLIREDAQDLGYEDILPDLDKIQTASCQLLGIISDILDISKIEADKLELNLFEFDLTELIEEIVTTMQPIVKLKENKLIVEQTDNLGLLYADRHKVAQILLNLLSNAAKFTIQGTITLTVSRKKALSTPDNPAEKPIDWICFQIFDTGVGIPPEQLSKIFEAFTQGDNSSTREHGGTGLGLTICEHFCKAMGGSIVVGSELDKGTTFTVHLPAISIKGIK